MKKDKYRTIRVMVDIDCDGDVYVSNGKGMFSYIGLLVGDDDRVITTPEGEIISSGVPGRGYLKARRISKK